MALQLATASTGVVRDSHYVVPTGASAPIRTLLLEPQRTNLRTWSNDLTNAVHTKVRASTLLNATGPDGVASSASTLTEDTSATTTHIIEGTTVTITANAAQAISVYAKANGRAQGRFRLMNGAGANGFGATFTLSGAGTVATVVFGTGTVSGASIEALSNGWYRVLVWGVVDAASTTAFYQFSLADNMGNLAYTGDGVSGMQIYCIQHEQAGVPSSPIPTAATTVTRSADSLYWSIPALNPPREMTVYVRGVNVGTVQEFRPVMSITNAGYTGARLQMVANTLANPFLVRHFNGTSDVLTTAGGGSGNVNDLMEWRGVLFANGSVQIGGTTNNGAEVVGSASGALALASAWSDALLFLNSNGTLANWGMFAFTHVCVALGNQSRAAMRAFAGVP